MVGAIFFGSGGPGGRGGCNFCRILAEICNLGVLGIGVGGGESWVLFLFGVDGLFGGVAGANSASLGHVWTLSLVPPAIFLAGVVSLWSLTSLVFSAWDLISWGPELLSIISTIILAGHVRAGSLISQSRQGVGGGAGSSVPPAMFMVGTFLLSLQGGHVWALVLVPKSILGGHVRIQSLVSVDFLGWVGHLLTLLLIH